MGKRKRKAGAARRRRARIDYTVALPDAVLLHILERVPDVPDLFRCAATCRRWLRLVAGSARRRQPAPFVAGLFHQVEGFWNKKPAPNCRPPLFLRLEARRRPACLTDLPLGSLVPDDPDDPWLFCGARPMASRNGLLLVQLTRLPSTKLVLAVYHPLTGSGARRIPPSPLELDPTRDGSCDVAGFALFASEDCNTSAATGQEQRHDTPSFQVLVISVHEDEDNGGEALLAHSYSSATGAWSAPVRCHPSLDGLTMSGPRAAAVARGTAHWLYRDEESFYTLDVSADASRISLNKIIPAIGVNSRNWLPPPFPCVDGDGRLSFLNLRRPDGRVLELWTKQQEHPNEGDEGSGWRLSELIELVGGTSGRRFVSFGEKSGVVLLAKHDGHGLTTLDLKSKKMEPVEGTDELSITDSWYTGHRCGKCDGYTRCGGCLYNANVLYEIDWPSYVRHVSAGAGG